MSGVLKSKDKEGCTCCFFAGEVAERRTSVVVVVLEVSEYLTGWLGAVADKREAAVILLGDVVEAVDADGSLAAFVWLVRSRWTG